jgi:hypothetical protein
MLELQSFCVCTVAVLVCIRAYVFACEHVCVCVCVCVHNAIKCFLLRTHTATLMHTYINMHRSSKVSAKQETLQR